MAVAAEEWQEALLLAGRSRRCRGFAHQKKTDGRPLTFQPAQARSRISASHTAEYQPACIFYPKTDRA